MRTNDITCQELLIREPRMRGREEVAKVSSQLPRPLLLSFFILRLCLGTLISGTVQGAEQESMLDAILKKEAEYCEKLSHVVLFYVCNEDIKETVYDPIRNLNRRFVYKGQVKKNRYIYEYQLIQKEGQVEEKRILIEENGNKTRQLDASVKLIRASYSKLVAGPIALFSEYWQELFTYRLTGESRIMGENVYVVEISPRQEKQTNLLYGKAWIKKDDFSIVKIQYEPESVTDIGNLQATMGSGSNLLPHFDVVTEFGYEHSGVRFPSRFIINEKYDIKFGESRFSKAELDVVYSSYKFFTVETSVIIK